MAGLSSGSAGLSRARIIVHLSVDRVAQILKMFLEVGELLSASLGEGVDEWSTSVAGLNMEASVHR
jgi:hypothetical protein